MQKTKQFPSALLEKFSRKLYPDPVHRETFLTALLTPKPYPPAILWCQPRPNPLPFDVIPPVVWQPDWVDRLVLGTKPGQHHLHHQGAYYVLDFSSVFAAVPLQSLTFPQSPKLVIDVCAAPGGKSILAWRSLQPDLLVANEVIGKRLGMLTSNLKRCHLACGKVTHLNVADLVAEYGQLADVVIVDAPCSGQSLLAKGTNVLGCFHPRTINHNAQRQKKIIATASQLVRPGGYLLYSTCTFSIEENEGVLDWFVQRFPAFQSLAVPALTDYQSPWGTSPQFRGYRLSPEQGLGAGAFTSLLQLA
ncbi:RsmB/NOP family class I SAM-dependent RNA methyltransferase [Thermosynechococcaceae cyanobacterium BACA0444]|uniref:RsmB/NOP family class I SAM-dependent RNA methyltransferase n=1 Tax=Pseudocalidococcus azoricus BACA0444 TaxID=2918990 RepID=A0AAE4JW08_9CYAN|nr:RsmB/NOP family class I SAM-dependent RNA methyltransferase [Pseudocalidococcus azoricus]MDS3860880.1 RsmB/NOP family class I SAM-dependent RNA methyltransferase [Pseudocalidococcus azoricus BACA0444]